MKYKDKHTVMSQFTDKNGILKAGALLRYMQEAAYNCMRTDGESYDELAARGLVFVISKINLSIYSDIRATDEIEVQTWALESDRYSFPRAYRVLKDAKIVAEASSVWALLDINKNRLVRASDIELGYRNDEPIDLDTPTKIAIPDTSMSLVGEREVRYSDTDRNGHMNNTVYADMICDHIFRTFDGRVSSMKISFLSEAPMGCNLKVYMAREDDTFYIRTLREDNKTNIEAQVMCESI